MSAADDAAVQVGDGDPAGTDQDYREAVDLGLAECARLAEAVGSMREIVRAAVQDAEVGEIGAGR